jgi:hypothetical protein
MAFDKQVWPVGDGLVDGGDLSGIVQATSGHFHNHDQIACGFFHEPTKVVSKTQTKR